MKPKTTLILAAALVVLAGIAYLSQWARTHAETTAGKPIFPALASAKPDAIDITTRSRTIELRRRGDAWVVASEGNHQAEPKKVDDILGGLDKFTTSTLISNSKDREASFGVDTSGIAVRISQGGRSLASFLVGKAGMDYMSSYIRPTDQHRVYQVPVTLRYTLEGADSWRKTTVLEVTPDKIASMALHCTKGDYTLEKDNSGIWKLTKPVQAATRPDAVQMMINMVANVRSTGFADSTLDSASTGLAADSARVTVGTSDGSNYTITVGKTNAQGQSFTRRSDDPVVYLVPRGRWNTIFRSQDAVQAGAAPTAPKAQGGALPPTAAKKP